MTSTWGSDALSDDAFLGGRFSALQPKRGFRSGVDAVLLAAAVPARAGDSVLELGAGVGVASLCLAARVDGLRQVAVERQEAYADLARQNAARCGTELEVITAALEDLPKDLRQCQFDHVFANPPYFRASARSAGADRGREEGMAEETPLEVWIDTAARRLAPKGVLTLIHRAERLAQLLAALDQRLGSLLIQPLAAREGAEAGLILLQARKGGRADLRLLAPIVMHQGTRHGGDRESYTPQINDVLRNGAALSLGQRAD